MEKRRGEKVGREIVLKWADSWFSWKTKIKTFAPPSCSVAPENKLRKQIRLVYVTNFGKGEGGGGRGDFLILQLGKKVAISTKDYFLLNCYIPYVNTYRY